MQLKEKSIAFHTLGCKLNYAETSSIARQMEKEGFVKKDFDAVADVYVINTCSVTDNADKECRQLVRRLQRKAPESLVVITGCYAQLKPKEIASIPGVDLVLGAAEKFNLPQHLSALVKSESASIQHCDIEAVEGFHSSFSMGDRTRTFLKVQDGCNYNCSFCTIPLARGKSRSDSIENVLTKIGELGNSGVKEIVLTGINLGDFGNEIDKKESTAQKESFFDLLKAIEETTAVPRYRISSIEPNLLSTEIIDLVANSQKIMPHFHIPLQSGSNKVLGSMRRRYKRELYAEKVKHIKGRIPHCAIGVDVIVGYPGETDADFEETYTFLEQLPISYLHVFTYSERENTLAATLPVKVPVHIRNARNRKLRMLSYAKQEAFNQQHRGQLRSVLVEHNHKNGMLEGFSDNYIKVSMPYTEKMGNQIIDWIL